jgi:hypothetical protein
MRTGGLRASCVAAAAVVCGSPALAQTPEVAAAPAESPSGDVKLERVLLYAGFDIWRMGRVLYGGFYWAPDGLNNDGFITRLFVSGGVERYDAGSKRSSTNLVHVAPLGGWRFKLGDFEIRLFGGPELENRPVDTPDARFLNPRIGARAAVELWWEPAPGWMLESTFSAATIDKAYSARAAAGWRLMDQFWLGPEMSVSGDAFSQQFRVGAHLTGFKWAAFEWYAAAGYLHDSFHRSGAYGRIGVLTRQ